MQEKIDTEKQVEKLERAQQKMDKCDYNAAIPILLEAAQLNPSSYLVFCGLITCYLNVGDSYILKKEHQVLENFEKIYHDQQEFSSEFGVVSDFINSIPSVELAEITMKKLAWIKNIDLSETLPKDKLLMNQMLKRIWMAVCIRAYFCQELIAAFEQCSSFQQQLGWREQCSIAYSLLAPDSSKKMIVLYEQAYQKNPRMDIAYHINWTDSYKILGNWDEVFKQLKIMAAKDMYDLDLKDLLITLRKNNYPKLEKEFFPQLKENPRPYYSLFWHSYFSNKIKKAEQTFANCTEGLPTFIQQTLQELQDAFGTHTTFVFYLYKATLLRLECKEAMAEISHAMDLISVDFILTTKLEYNYIEIIPLIYHEYYKELCERKPNQDFTTTEAFNVARVYISGGKLLMANIVNVPLVKKMFPVAEEMLRLRLARATAWHDNYSPDIYNGYTEQINALLDRHKIYGQTNRTINTLPTLFASAAAVIRKTHLHFDPAKYPAEVVARFRSGEDNPLGLEFSEPESRSYNP